MTLTLADYKVSRKQDLLAFLSCTHFNGSTWNLMSCWSNLCLTSWCCLDRSDIYWYDFIRYVFNTGLCFDTNELICFRLGMMLVKSKFAVWFQFEWHWLSFTVTGLQERWNLCSHSVVKLHEITDTVVMVKYVRKIAAKKSHKYGLLEHILLWYWISDRVQKPFKNEFLEKYL